MGPGIVLDAAWVGRGDRHFRTPGWQDLVIAEAHVRDLTARAPAAVTADERLGFTGLRRWVESPDFYLHRLGVNCVELQPVHENDAQTAERIPLGLHDDELVCAGEQLLARAGRGLRRARVSGARWRRCNRRGLAV